MTVAPISFRSFRILVPPSHFFNFLSANIYLGNADFNLGNADFNLGNANFNLGIAKIKVDIAKINVGREKIKKCEGGTNKLP